MSSKGVEGGYHPVNQVGVGFDFGLFHFVEEGKGGIF